MKYDFTNFKIELKKVEDFLSKIYKELNIGRASPLVLDSIMVEAYGSMQPLKNISSISIEDPKTLKISPWDKNHIKQIEKAIMVSNLGLSTSPDDTGIRVIFPQLTGENRQKLIKVIKEKLEDARITVRQERQNVLDDISKKEKEGNLNEDEKKFAKDELQKIIDEVNNNLENLFKNKEKEIIG